MCGRYASASSVDDLVVTFGADGVEGDLPEPSWNVAPTDPVPVVVERGGTASHGRRRVVRPARWGLVPGWATDVRGAARMINARVETVAAAPAFRSALSRRRCVVPADGWFEWHAPPALEADRGGRPGRADRVRKVPTFLRRADGRMLGFAGVFERWSSSPLTTGTQPTGVEPVWTVAIVTCASVGPHAWLHDRMPAVVTADRMGDWLDRGRTDGSAALGCLAPAGTLDLVAHRVGREVGDVRAQGPHLVEPLDADRVPGRGALF